LTRHGSGLHVLAAPPAIERSRFTSEQISEGLEVIRSVFSCVVLDLPHDLDPSTVTALDGSDDVLYMVGLSVPAVRVSAAGLQALKHIGIEQRKIKVVVSRADAREDVSLKQAREALGLSVFWRIPNDYPTVVSSVNDGTPFVLSSPRSEIARNIRQLGEKLSQGPVSGAEGTAKATSLLRRVLPYAI
jgi:pilus assembly protein CpaE